MKGRGSFLILLVTSLVLGFHRPLSAYALDREALDYSSVITIDFEDLSDLISVDSHYTYIGVSFTGATILSQGGSLNYLHFPPRSGVNVIYDDPNNGGVITVEFNNGLTGNVTRAGGYITGNTNITMTAYDANDNVLGSVETGGPNFDPGDEDFDPPPIAPPNMLLEIISTDSIATVKFSDTGNTFTVDDFFFESEQSCEVVSVPLYKQSTGTWANDPYGGTTTNPWRFDDDNDGLYDEGGSDTPETIAKWGCALSSAAMLVSYHGNQQNGFTTTPQELNDWLKANSGYSGGSVKWPSVAQYARANGVDLYHYSGWGPDEGVVNGFLCNSSPIILNTNSSPYINGHFVVATGQADPGAWDINDPGGFDLAQLGTNSYLGYRKFGTTVSDPSEINIAVHSAVELLIVDPAGRKIGFDPATGEYINEILDASYEVEIMGARDGSNGQIETLVFNTGAPLSGVYSIQLVGMSNGIFEIDFTGYDSAGGSSNAAITGTIVKDSAIDVSLVYSEIPGTGIYVEQITFLPTHYLPLLEKN
jgi:hypothetical protein